MLARALAPDLLPAPGAVVLRSDVERKAMFGADENARLPQEAYEHGVTAKVYATLEEKARRVLAAGHSAVADAVFADPDERKQIQNAAGAAAFRGLFLTADLATRVSRVGGRTGDASDADAAVARAQEQYDLGTLDWAKVDASGAPEETLRKRGARGLAVLKLCAGRPAAPPPCPMAAPAKSMHSCPAGSPPMSAHPSPSAFSARHLAVGLAGYCAFVNLYSPQSILPLLTREFGATAAQVSSIITVSTLAVAVTAPFTGTVADVLGRKRVIVAAMFVLVVPTMMVALSNSLSALIFWRAVQGLVLPPIFAVTVAYIGDEWPHQEATTAAGIYSSGSSLGGFSGRLVTGFLADLIGWRAGFLALGGHRFCRRDRRLVPAAARTQIRALGRAAGVGAADAGAFPQRATGRDFCRGLWRAVQFHLHVHLRELPSRGAALQFVGQLAGRDFRGLSDRLGAHALDRLGGRPLRAAALHGAGDRAVGRRHRADAGAVAGADHSSGLAISAGCGLICQAVSTGYVAITAKSGRSSAVGLYVTSFYVGGSFGAALGGIAWTLRRLAGLRCAGVGDAGGHGGDRFLRLGAAGAGGEGPADRAALLSLPACG